MLPEILNRHGYLTVAVDNLIHTGAEWFARGYVHYVNTGGIIVISKGMKIKAEKVNEAAFEALEWGLKKCGSKGFFMFIHYWDPHTPYLPPQKYVEKFYWGDPSKGDLKERLNKTPWGRHLLHIFKGWMDELIKSGVNDKSYVDALYDAEILYVDEKIGDLLTRIDELGLTDDTAIILTSDHGELLGEHEIYYDHHGLYEEDIKVPLIIRYPPQIPQGTKIDSIVSHMDLLPTILDLTNIKSPNKVTGNSLLKLLNKEWSGYSMLCIIENTRMTKRALRTKEWKLIETLRPDIYGNPPGHLELYNLKEDPKENENLTEKDEETALYLLGKLERLYRSILEGKGDPLIEQEISMPIQ